MDTNPSFDQGQPPAEPIPEAPMMQPVPPKKSNRTMWIIIIVVVVVLCCCCVAGIAGYYAYNVGVFSNLMGQ